MRSSIVLLGLATSLVNAAYTRDIVQYWVDQTALLVNGTVIGGVQSPVQVWIPAVVHTAIYAAALNSQSQGLALQQVAVSHAAHNTLSWAFHGTHNYYSTDQAIIKILGLIGLNSTSSGYSSAVGIGQAAARQVISARADDGINLYVQYDFGPQNPGVYQVTPGGASIPDTPQARFVRLFAALGNVTQFTVPPPPKISDPTYEANLTYVKAQGAVNSTVRTPFDKNTAYFWRESSVILWSRIANAVIGDSLANNVTASAKFYAQFNYALANAGIAAWNIKFYYNAWRPVTAIHRTDIWLPSGHNVSDPNWVPLLSPTPSHQDYVSTHSTFGGAASQVLRSYLGKDAINITVSSNVTVDNVGVITRSYTNLTYTALENGNSRVFGGIHFPFARDAGIAVGTQVALATLKNFDANWQQF